MQGCCMSISEGVQGIKKPMVLVMHGYVVSSILFLGQYAASCSNHGQSHGSAAWFGWVCHQLMSESVDVCYRR